MLTRSTGCNDSLRLRDRWPYGTRGDAAIVACSLFCTFLEEIKLCDGLESFCLPWLHYAFCRFSRHRRIGAIVAAVAAAAGTTVKAAAPAIRAVHRAATRRRAQLAATPRCARLVDARLAVAHPVVAQPALAQAVRHAVDIATAVAAVVAGA